jgi:hypothetical protein
VQANSATQEPAGSVDIDRGRAVERRRPRRSSVAVIARPPALIGHSHPLSQADTARERSARPLRQRPAPRAANRPL